MDVMDKMLDKDASITELVDGYFNYKINRYKNYMDFTFKRIKGEFLGLGEELSEGLQGKYSGSDIIMADILEPQFLINSIQDKIIGSH